MIGRTVRWRQLDGEGLQQVYLDAKRRDAVLRGHGVGYTELFFLAAVTALAAGHRPCFECRQAVLTPRSIVGILSRGYHPAWQWSAGRLTGDGYQ